VIASLQLFFLFCYFLPIQSSLHFEIADCNTKAIANQGEILVNFHVSSKKILISRRYREKILIFANALISFKYILEGLVERNSQEISELLSQQLQVAKITF
jgi:hypothetical protein